MAKAKGPAKVVVKNTAKVPAKAKVSDLAMRIGFGWDSHAFKAGIPLLIGGVRLEYDKGLGGHSDGDVLLHAITDALLGNGMQQDVAVRVTAQTLVVLQ